MTHFQTPWGHSKQQHRSIVPWLWQKAFAQLGMLALISPISAAGLLRVTLPITTCQTQRSLHMAPCPEWHVCVHVFILASRVCANMSILPPIVPLVNQCVCEKKTTTLKQTLYKVTYAGVSLPVSRTQNHSSAQSSMQSISHNKPQITMSGSFIMENKSNTFKINKDLSPIAFWQSLVNEVRLFYLCHLIESD